MERTRRSILLTPTALALFDGRAFAAGHPTLTGKERLTDKGSDEQRVDDCNVPVAERTRKRPTRCPWDKTS